MDKAEFLAGGLPFPGVTLHSCPVCGLQLIPYLRIKRYTFYCAKCDRDFMVHQTLMPEPGFPE